LVNQAFYSSQGVAGEDHIAEVKVVQASGEHGEKACGRWAIGFHLPGAKKPGAIQAIEPELLGHHHGLLGEFLTIEPQLNAIGIGDLTAVALACQLGVQA